MNGHDAGRRETGQGGDTRPEGAAFPARARLLSAAQFDRVFKHAARSQDRCFTVLARRNALAYARLGLAVARKASGNAVVRNRLKRTIRESFRLSRPKLPAVDLVVMVKPGISRIPASDLRRSLTKHWQEISRKCAG